jgi:phage protein D
MFDYKSVSLVNDIASAIGGESRVKYAMNCIAAQTTLAHLAQIAASDAKVVWRRQSYNLTRSVY